MCRRRGLRKKVPHWPVVGAQEQATPRASSRLQHAHSALAVWRYTFFFSGSALSLRELAGSSNHHAPTPQQSRARPLTRPFHIMHTKKCPKHIATVLASQRNRHVAASGHHQPVRPPQNRPRHPPTHAPQRQPYNHQRQPATNLQLTRGQPAPRSARGQPVRVNERLRNEVN